MEYRQYHEENGNVFHSETNIYFSQSGVNKVMSLVELLKMSSDIAVEDYRQRGFTHAFLKEHGIAILVSRVSFRIHSMPGENDNIEFVTWEEKPEPLQLMRCYKILDKNGNLLVSGKSSWLLVDLEKRRIMPTKLFTLRSPQTEVFEMDCMKPGKIVLPENMEFVEKRKIRFSDLDANGHVNNSRYASYIEDVLPSNFRNLSVKDFRINFSKEAMLDEELDIMMAVDEDAKKITVCGKKSSETSFESEIQF